MPLYAYAMLRHPSVRRQLCPAAPAWPGIRHLRPGECLTLGLPDRLRMTCVRGLLRVSGDGDTPSCDVCEGQTYWHDRSRQLVVMALAHSTLVLAPASAPLARQ